ncbi:MAG TPA: outer membrane beta-barrel protein [Azospirillum sp.]|nr:outer membrane beta-barrel protein [Azospirillum sp.]
MTRRFNEFARGLPVLCAVALGALALTAATPALGGDGPIYLRADVGYGASRDAKLEDADPGGRNPLYGAGNWVNGDVGRSVALGAGIGVRVLPALRAEAAVHWLPGLEYTGVTRRSGAAVRADADGLALMANVYLDLDRLDGSHGDGPIHPWVSAGLGTARTHLGTVRTEAAGRTITAPGGTSWRFAWSLGFGAAVDLTDSLALDLGYRYLDMGKVRTDGGTAQMVSAAGTFTGPVDPVEARLRTHLVTVGLRYSF